MDLRYAIDEIRRNTDLRQLMPDVVRVGANHTCKCMFHEDSNPSMVVHKEFYLCFGCGATGDIVSWYTDHWKMSFGDALGVAAVDAGIELNEDIYEYLEKARVERDSRLEELANYRAKLTENEKAQEYLTGRGLTQETIDFFRLGYRPDWHAIAIPMYSKSGNLDAISYRYMGDGEKRYHHKNTDSWRKGDTFYNIRAIEFEEGPIIVCEGMFDAMSIWQAGFKRVVAIMGGALNDNHIKELGDNSIIFVPDAKTPHDFELFRKSVFRVRKAYPNLIIRVALLPEGDANSVSVDDLQAAIDNAEGAEFAILKSDIAKCLDRESEYKVARIIGKAISDPLVKDDIERWLALRWDKERDVVKQALIRSDGPVTHVKTMAEALIDLEEREQRAAIEGLGFYKLGLEKFIDRPHTGQVALVAARTSVGKTVIALNVLYNCCKYQVPTVFISQEQPSSELVCRLSLMLSGDTTQIDGKTLRHNIRTNSDWWISQKARLIDMFPHVRFEERRLTPETVKDCIIDSSYSIGQQVKMVFIDYLGLLKTTARNQTAYERMSSIGLDIQQVTKELDVFNTSLMQLSRAGGDGTEPVRLDMMRDAGTIEEMADYIIGAWRDKDRSQDQEMGVSKMYMNVCKNRHGATVDKLDLWLNLSTLRLYSVDGLHQYTGQRIDTSESRKSDVDAFGD